MVEKKGSKKQEDETGQAIKEDDETTPDSLSETESLDEDWESKFSALEKDHLYLRAELDNIKRQNIKERSQLLKYGGERLAKELLETLDVFRSALTNEINPENYQDFVEGIKMTAESLKTTLEKHGVVEVECVGKPFDPNTQEALSSETSDDLPEGHVTQVFKSPFLYHDKLLRAGQVIVSRAKTE